MKRYAITGADGMIGRHLVQTLRASGASPRVLLLPNAPVPSLFEGLEIVRGDIRHRATVERFVDGADVVFHLAALVGRAANGVPLAMARDVNVGGTRNVLDAVARSKDTRAVFLSTCCVYGLHGFEEQVLDETSPHVPLALPYDVSKAEAEILVSGTDPQATQWTILQVPVALGGVHTVERPTAMSLIRLARTGLAPRTRGAGIWTNYVFGADVAAALAMLGEHREAVGQTFIHSESVPLHVLISWIARELNIRCREVLVPHIMLRTAARAAHSAIVLANRRRFASEKIGRLGFAAPVGLERGVHETIQHYRAAGLI
ncbi:NAD-dependent epimerase/dehydratase family protein [Aliihoeflea sp. PC F10.4]